MRKTGKSHSPKPSREKPHTGAETLATTAYEQLRFDIISGVFEPGAKLLIRELCERYGIGLGPVREALNRMSRDGIVQQNDQRGFSVTAATEEDLEDIINVRCWANEKALRSSIAMGDQAWEENLVLAYHRLSRIELPTDGKPKVEREQAHRVFHNALIAACGSKWLMDFCEQLFDAADRYRFLSRRQYGIAAKRPDDHREIMEAALRRDGDEAVRLLQHHFRQTLEFGRAEIRRLAKLKAETNKQTRARKLRAIAGETAKQTDAR